MKKIVGNGDERLRLCANIVQWVLGMGFVNSCFVRDVEAALPTWTIPIKQILSSNNLILNMGKVAHGYHKVMEDSALVNTYLGVKS